MATIEQKARSWPWGRINFAGVVLNIAGIALYCWFCSPLWQHPAFAPETGDVNMAVVMAWGSTALPVFLLCTVVDLIWLVLVLLRSRPPLLWRSCLLLAMVAAGWVGCWWYARVRFNGESLGFSPPTKVSKPNHALQPTAGAGGVPAEFGLDSRPGGG